MVRLESPSEDAERLLLEGKIVRGDRSRTQDSGGASSVRVRIVRYCSERTAAYTASWAIGVAYAGRGPGSSLACMIGDRGSRAAFTLPCATTMPVGHAVLTVHNEKPGRITRNGRVMCIGLIRQRLAIRAHSNG